MKRITLLIIGLAIAFSTDAQTILTYKTHGLLPNEKNPMRLTKYVDPGTSGQNVTWDFSTLEETVNFTGSIEQSYITKGGERFSTSNTALEEFGNFFFFNSNSYQLEQYGYLSNNGNTIIEYTTPFVKMRYPFSYNSSYSGFFDGKYIFSDKEIGTISGTYDVTGDAIGTLKLPEEKLFRNTLRVKEVKSYNQIINGVTTKIEETTYRWYINEHRFPILVFISCSYTFENGQTSTSTKAAYNSDVLTSANSLPSNSEYTLEVFPNPYSEKVNIKLHLEKNSKISISVYDLIGKKISVLADKNEDAGDFTYNFSAKDLGLARGTYIVKVVVNNRETTRKILEL